MIIRLAISLLCGCLLQTSAFRFEVLKPNKGWECVGCGDPRNNPYVFSMVKEALYRESREVYLNFDHSWIDTLLSNGQKVVVTMVNREILSEYRHPSMDNSTTLDFPSQVDIEETYHVVVSLPTNILSVLNSTTIQPLTYREALKIDHFLMHNPCWLPVHDPPVRLYQKEGVTIDVDVPDNTQLPTCSNDVRHADDKIPDLFSMKKGDFSKIVKNAAVFARLPAMNFYGTCLLYNLITQRQFPQQCPTGIKDISSVLVYKLSNIGWSHCARNAATMFLKSLSNDLLFMIPTPEIFNMIEKNTSIIFRGSPVDVLGTWKWADSFACDKYSLALNPWSCHFIPITNCTDPDLRTNFNKNVGTYVETYEELPDVNQTSTFNKFITFLSSQKVLEKFEDGWKFKSINYWVYMRLLSFFQRPNIQTRALLRHSLSSIKPLDSHFTHAVTSQTQKEGSVLALTDQKDHWNNRHAALQPCVGVHIRHGDSHIDWREELHLDRSVKHFALLAKKTGQRLGITNFYLATDNKTAFKEITTRYSSDMNWFAQVRPLKDWKGGIFTYFHHNSKKRDLTDILADMIAISRCSAFVAAFDSQFADFMRQYQCSRNKLGECPPSINRGALGELHGDVFIYNSRSPTISPTVAA